jgi:hypothetical protein
MTWDGAPVLTYASLPVRQILICICQGHCRRLSWRCGNGVDTSQKGKEHLVHLVHRDGQEYREKESRRLVKPKKIVSKTRWSLMYLLLSS